MLLLASQDDILSLIVASLSELLTLFQMFSVQSPSVAVELGERYKMLYSGSL